MVILGYIINIKKKNVKLNQFKVNFGFNYLFI